MKELLSVSEAREKLLAALTPATASPEDIERVQLSQAAGRVLAEDVHSSLDLPPFANSSMDGFAVRAADVEGAQAGHPVILKVVADIAAGLSPDVHLQPGQAARIMTGAPLPEGADAVVPVEDTDFNNRQAGVAAPDQVQIFVSADPGQYVRPRGQDVHTGELVMKSRRRLNAAEVGFLAMLGMKDIPVFRRPRVGLFSSGDELLASGEPLKPGKIYESNSYTLAALIQEWGGEALHLGIAADEAEAVQRLLDRAVEEKVDLILSSAGVSVGAFDFVRSVVEAHGSLSFWRVNMRPGKPLAFGNYRGIPFAGLPGNPVSAFVSFQVFIRPALQKMAGEISVERQTIRVQLAEPVESDGRESYLRAIVTPQKQPSGERQWQARLTGHQGSGNLRSLVQANALLIVPSGVKSLPAGAETDAWILNDELPG